MLKIIAAIIAVAIAAVLIYAAMQPNTFRVQRSASIKAPPEKIFPLMNDFKAAKQWSPYEQKDPAMKRSYSGPASGKGSVYEFDGDRNVGSGRIEILESVPPRRVILRLDMTRPMNASHTIEYLLEPKGDATEVTWAMHGEAPFLSRVMCLFFDMDKMVGDDFEKGLATLKAVVEK